MTVVTIRLYDDELQTPGQDRLRRRMEEGEWRKAWRLMTWYAQPLLAVRDNVVMMKGRENLDGT